MTALGGVETGKQNAIDTDAAHGTIKYIGLIDKFSAISHSTAAKIIIVDELEVTCVMILITRQQRNIINTDEMPIYKYYRI